MSSRTPLDVREERKVVTALFADLVGSTQLAERLDAEELKLVLQEAVGRIVGAVHDYGGYVKDLAGDGVLAFFGAPYASEDDPERAIRAGLRIVADIAAYGEEVETAWGAGRLAVRVGITTGPVVLGLVGGRERVEYGAFGDTVNTAARLQGAAAPGVVLVDDTTMRQVEPLFDWREPQELQLKGKEAPVTAVEVVAPRPHAGRVRGLAGVEAPVVGRDRELAAAREVAEAALAGTGGVLFVTGEAGIGKSRLVAELRSLFDGAAAGQRTPLWIEARCVSYGESLPYLPYRDLLREWLGVGPTEPELRLRIALRRAVEELFADRADEIYPYLGALLGLTLEPDATARLAQLSPEALQYRTFEVVATLVERLAADRPFALVVEDLHWADATSIQLTEQLIAVTERTATLLVITQRDERDHGSWGLKERAARDFPHLTRELVLQPLGTEVDRALLRALIGDVALPEHVERDLLEHAEGNPFYLEELTRSLVDAGALVAVDGGWQFDHAVPLDIPPTVEKVILTRIDRLPEPTHGVLTAASALGRRFGVPLLEAVVPDVDLEPALHELQRLDFIRPARRWPQPEYRFKHSLSQEAAYRTLLGERRRELHRLAAEWLEQNGEDDAGLLAHHWLAADDEAKAAEYLVRAGDAARHSHALDEAIDHYRALLPLLERSGRTNESALVLFKLALALHMSLRFGEANSAFERAFALWEPPAPSGATATLRMGTEVLPTQPDPAYSYAPTDMQLQMALFDRLVERWPEATIVPSLAESWTISDDGLRYEFRLREGLRWSDGSTLTAHDVVDGVLRTLDPTDTGVSVAVYYVLENAQAYAHGDLEDREQVGVRALDERTVEFRLAAPAPYFLSVVNRPDAGPRPSAIDPGDVAGARVVSGAFVVDESDDDHIALARRADAPPRGGNVERVELRRLSLAEALPEYERGSLDVLSVQAVSASALDVPVDHPDARLGPPAWTFYLVFDMRDPAAADRDLRLALAHAIDRSALAETLPRNLNVATGGIVPPALHGHTPEIAPRFDPDRAREHYARAATRGPLAIATTAAGPAAHIVAALVAGWRDVLGLEVESRVPEGEFSRVRMRLVEQAPVAPSAWFPGYPDPEYYLRLLLHSAAKDNAGHWSHPPYDELIERARAESDGRKRLELFHAADRMAIAEQAAVIPLVYGRNVMFVKPHVRGWWEFGKSWSSFADLVVGDVGT